MAGRKPREEDDVSLFPFLSILACLIGTLVLMIMAVALSQMDSGVVAVAETYANVQKQLRDAQAAVKELLKTVTEQESQGSSIQKQLADARDELKRVEEEIARLMEEAKKSPEEKPEAEKAADQQELEKRQEELKKLQERIKELLAELEKRKTPPEEAQVTIRPSGSGIDLEPTFIECNDQGIVIYDESGLPYRVATSAIKSDAKFIETLKRISENEKASVIFLVRSDGLSTYNQATAMAKSHYARHGKLPVIGKGKIDLSLFRGK